VPAPAGGEAWAGDFQQRACHAPPAPTVRSQVDLDLQTGP